MFAEVLVPPQLAALALEVVEPTQGIVCYPYIAAAVLLEAVFFRGQWRRLPRGPPLGLAALAVE
ncbi:hypothetical protein [Streptomyces kronopolitis]